MFKKIIDISWPVSPAMTTYKDRRDVRFMQIATFERDSYRLSAVELNAHTGTHIDAPSHFLEQGVTLDQMSLASMIGPCKVLDLTNCTEKITAADLAAHDITAGDRVLCKTTNSKRSSTEAFDAHFVYLAQDAAQWLVERKIKLLGIDYIGIERVQAKHETHCLLMENDIVILEGIRLADVAPGTYQLVCLPMHLLGTDGAPARAVLLQD